MVSKGKIIKSFISKLSFLYLAHSTFNIHPSKLELMNRRKAIQQTAYLLGGAVSASVIAGVMSGCQPTGAPDWTPQFLTKEQAAMIEEIAEIILPETDTPGAKSMHLTEFVDKMVHEVFNGFEQLQFSKGLDKFEEQCQFFTGKNFMNCSSDERHKFLTIHEPEAIATQQKTGEKSWFSSIKELVLVGYFTSEYAITELMNYNPIPQKFEGCVDVAASPKIQVGIEGRSA